MAATKDSPRVQELKRLRKLIGQLIVAQRASERSTAADTRSTKASRNRDEAWQRASDAAKSILTW